MGRRVIWTHTVCMGPIDTKKRKCTKCGYTWSRPHFLFDPYSIRPIITYEGSKETNYWKVIDRVPVLGLYATEIAKRLPNWPRWLRIISVLVTYSLLGLAILFLLRGFLSC